MGPTLHNSPTPTLHLVYKEVADMRLDTVLDVMDELHEAAADNRLPQVTTMSKADLLGLLHEIIFTAQETLHELENQTEISEATDLRNPPLALVRRSS